MNGFLRDTVTIERATTSKSASQFVTQSWATSSSGVAASIQPKRASYRQAEYGRETLVTHRGFFLPTVDIVRGDRVVFGTERFLVEFVSNVVGHHLEVDLSRITDP